MFDDLLGKEFEYHGRGPDTYDCYGLALEVARRVGIDFPPHPSYTSLQDKHNAILYGLTEWKKIETPELYSLIVFSIRPPYVTHVGVVLDYNRFIHISPKTRVTIERFDRDPWKLKVRGFYKWQK
jgi:cell wall-associated NlpC family hydrolase